MSTRFSLFSLLLVLVSPRGGQGQLLGRDSSSSSLAAKDVSTKQQPSTLNKINDDDGDLDLELVRGIYYGELSLDPHLGVFLSDGNEFRPVLDSFVSFWTAMCNRTGGIRIVGNIVSTSTLTPSGDSGSSDVKKPYLVQLQKLQAHILADVEASSARGVNFTVLENLRDEDDVVVFFEVGRGMVEVAHKLKVVDGVLRKMMLEGVGGDKVGVVVPAAKEAQDRMDLMSDDEEDVDDDDDEEEDDDVDKEFMKALMQKVDHLGKKNMVLQASMDKLARVEL